MKKIFISQPMKDLSEDKILNKRKELQTKITKVIKEPVEFLESYFNSFKMDKQCLTGLYYLGKSISLMAESDIVYFGKGWNKTRGCRFEHDIARAYGLKILYEEN